MAVLYFSVIWLSNIDDEHRNTNMNNKDHLVGQLTTLIEICGDLPADADIARQKSRTQSGLAFLQKHTVHLQKKVLEELKT